MKRPEWILKIDKPYIGGEIRNKNFIIELPKRKSIIVSQTRRKQRNPNRIHIFTIPMKEGTFSFVYYKDNDTFKGFYRGGVHSDSCNLSNSYLYRMLRNIQYVTVRKKQLRGRAILMTRELIENNIKEIQSWKKPFDINKVKE